MIQWKHMFMMLSCLLIATGACSDVRDASKTQGEQLAMRADKQDALKIPHDPPILACHHISQAGAAHSSGVVFALWRNGVAVFPSLHLFPGCDLCVAQLSPTTVDKIVARFEQSGLLDLPGDPPGPVGTARVDFRFAINSRNSKHAYVLSDLADPAKREAITIDKLVQQCRPASSTVLPDSDDWNTAVVQYVRDGQWTP